MRKIRSIVLCFLLSWITTFAFSQNVDSVSSVDATSSATVVFMRATGYNGSATAFTTFIDDSLVCRLNKKRFSTHSVRSGQHVFSVQFAGKISKEKAEHISINTEAGKTYYIQLVFQPGLLVNNLFCQEVTESSAKAILPKLKQDSQCL